MRNRKMDEKPKFIIKDTTVYTKDLKIALERCPEISAVYLFGSSSGRGLVANDLDILVLLQQGVDKDEAYINITHNLSKSLKIREAFVDLLFFDLEEADPIIMARAVNQGILLINRDPEYLSNMIDSVSRYLLENETMMIRAQRLRQERTEAFGEA